MPKSVGNAKPGSAVVREVTEVIGGVDTHSDTHTVVALDQIGGRLGAQTFATTAAGYRALLGWLSAFGPVSESRGLVPMGSG